MKRHTLLKSAAMFLILSSAFTSSYAGKTRRKVARKHEAAASQSEAKKLQKIGLLYIEKIKKGLRIKKLFEDTNSEIEETMEKYSEELKNLRDKEFELLEQLEQCEDNNLRTELKKTQKFIRMFSIAIKFIGMKPEDVTTDVAIEMIKEEIVAADFASAQILKEESEAQDS